MTYSSPIPNPQSPTPNPQRHWLTLGVVALAVAGLFALVLVVARTPGLARIELFNRFFHDALVVHVDLSVLIWFLSIACLMWQMLAAESPTRLRVPYLEKAALLSFAGGMFFIAASPFDSAGEPLMSNYIPVITNVPFFLGLALSLCGVALSCVRLLIAAPDLQVSTAMGAYTAMLITVLALACFIWSYHLVPPVIEGAQYYEMLFWGGGHVLQFTHTQILMVSWLVLGAAVLGREAVSPRLARACFLFAFLAACLSPLAYMLYAVESMEFRQFFTDQMIALSGLAPAVMMLVMARALWLSPRPRHGLTSALICSLLLFAYGGLLGALIHGQNVVIPAHYHGSIVGVTLAFMGVAYLLLPKFGWRDVTSSKLAYWQPIVYAAGQAMHISGLAWSGGYGVLRKTPGGMEALPVSVKVALGVMGTGGLIAIVGGLLFVVVCWKAMRR